MSDQTVGARDGNIMAWVLQGLLAVYYLYSAYTLVFTDDHVRKFDEIGFGQWYRYTPGVLEIAGAIGLLIPVLCGLAALGLTGLMVGAVFTEIFLVEKGDAILPALLLVICAVLAWYRRDTIRALFGHLRPRAATGGEA